MKRFIRINRVNNVIIGIRYGEKITEGEIESEKGEIGQILQKDGTFVTPEVNIPEPQETAVQKIERLELQVQQDNLILFDVLATIYDELLTLKGSV